MSRPPRRLPFPHPRWPYGPLAPTADLLPRPDAPYAWARALQTRLAPLVRRVAEPTAPSTVAGLDIALGRTRAVAAALLFSYPSLELLEEAHADGVLGFPYIPGLLTYREAPLLLEALSRLSRVPDLVLVDGQGIAHPRRLGIAAHLGLVLDLPAIGVAKSLLCGEHREPGPRRGGRTRIVDRGETIGAALRTREGKEPVYVSIGHRVDLATAVRIALRCCDGHRVPAPTRLADRRVAELKRALAL